MAANKDTVEKKLTFLKYQEGVHTYEDLGKDIFEQDKSNKCPTYVHRTPPCQGSCPSGEDIRGWLDIVRGIEKHLQISACKNMLLEDLLLQIHFHL